MRYVQSLACKQAVKSIKKVQGNLRVVSGDHRSSSIILQYSTSFSVVHAFSVLENYFDDLFHGWSVIFNSTLIKAGSLPLEFRVSIACQQSIVDLYKGAIVNGGRPEFISKTVKAIQEGKFAALYAPDRAVSVTKHVIVSGGKYPSIDNISKIATSFGCNNIFDQTGAVCGFNTKLELMSFNDVRNEIAHEASLSSKTSSDLIDSMDKIISFIKAFDGVAWRHIGVFEGKSTWPR